MNGDALVNRIAGGLSTEQDAWLVQSLIDKVAAYEEALRQIAICGSGESAMRALVVLTAGGARIEQQAA
jgi:hypothetical protein